MNNNFKYLDRDAAIENRQQSRKQKRSIMSIKIMRVILVKLLI